MAERDIREYENDGDPTAEEDAAWNELMDRRAVERRQRDRRQPELHGRAVSPALVEHEADRAARLRERLAALAPQDPHGTTTSEGEEPW